MDLKQQAQLQERANKRLMHKNFDRQIQIVANKPLPLTRQDIAQLTHFVEQPPEVRQNTVYWGNSIISPVVTQHKTIKIGEKS